MHQKELDKLTKRAELELEELLRKDTPRHAGTVVALRKIINRLAEEVVLLRDESTFPQGCCFCAGTRRNGQELCLCVKGRV